MSKEAMKLALDYLDGLTRALKMYDTAHAYQVTAALREALAEQPAQQQEPAAWLELLREARDNCKASIVEEGISTSRKEYRIDLEARLTAALNTSPPAQRKPLTDEELYKVFPAIATYTEANKTLYRSIARAIEAAHSIKENT